MGGGDKGLRVYRGQRLLDRVIAKIAPQLDGAPLALNANGDAARFASYGLPVLPDPVAGQPGPLAGILAAMDWAAALGHTHVLTVPVDSPCLPDDLVARLRAVQDHVTMATSHDGTVHPVIALWPTAAAPALRDALAREQRRVRAFADTLGVTYVAFAAADPDPFTNINHLAEIDTP